MCQFSPCPHGRWSAEHEKEAEEVEDRSEGCTEDLQVSWGLEGSIALSTRHFNNTCQMTLLYRLARCPAAQSA